MASSIGGAAYVMNSGDDRDTGNGFEVRDQVVPLRLCSDPFTSVHEEEKVASAVDAGTGGIRPLLLETCTWS
jgi:hypothetical protein